MKTALQQFIEWGDKMMLDHPLKVLSFAQAIDKAEELLEVEQQQIELAWEEGAESEYQYHVNSENRKDSQSYYNETYGGNK